MSLKLNTLLAIDTSTERASIALAIGDETHVVTHDNVREHAQFILPLVEQLLTQAGVSFSSLDGIVLGRGPGSFTGVRIACSVVKGLAYPHQLPVYPVSGLAAIADEVCLTASGVGRVLTVIDARMHEVYWDCYERDGSHREECVGPMASIVVPGNQPFMLAGVGVDNYWPELSKTLQAQCVKREVVYPDTRAMIRIVRAGRSNPMSVGDVLPVYVRNQVVQGASNG